MVKMNEPKRSPGIDHNILVVSRDTNTIDSITSILGDRIPIDKRYNIKPTTDFEEAVGELKKSFYEIAIVSSIEESDKSVDLIKHINDSTDLETLVIALTPRVLNENLNNRALDAGATLLEPVPICPANLRNTVERTLEILGGYTDPLTKLYKKEIFHERLGKELKDLYGRREEDHEIGKEKRHGIKQASFLKRAYRKIVTENADQRIGDNCYSLLFMDLDRFKGINDKYGHGVGDKVLKEVASAITSITRSSDIQSRWGGDEFGIGIRGCSYENALNVAQKILEAVNNIEIYADSERIQIATSIGVVTATTGEKFIVEEFFKAADETLYHAKGFGRCNVKGYPDYLAANKAKLANTK